MALLSFAIAPILMGGIIPNAGTEMRSDEIEAVGIDGDGSLWVKPASCTFPFIYRAAMEVNWDDGRQCLYAPKPREWSYSKWFRQIIDAARSEYGTELRIVPTTSWSNVEVSLRREFSASIDGG
ncbi:hypothetical protein [Bradyrhizobium sp.]|uniref:hypothetical protein n=1 Tax=Bradyrhizobium sp. TaxID=376 RepID=UPI003520833A